MDMQEIEYKIGELKLDKQTEDGGNHLETTENNPEELNIDEFIRFISQLQQDTVTEELKEAYRRFSGQDDTEIGFGREQLMKTMDQHREKLSHDEAEQLFQELDVDQDGYINFNDFVRSMMMR